MNDTALKDAQAIFGSLVVDVIGDYQKPLDLAVGVDLEPDMSADIADDDGITLKFVNGHEVRFSTSEWATIQRVK